MPLNPQHTPLRGEPTGRSAVAAMIPYTFRQLEIFVAAAEDCHFARTANRLGISQPAVTHHILTLEEQLGRQLFIRRRGTTPLLSTDGIAFLKQSRRMLEVGQTMDRFRASSTGKEVARIRVAAGAHILEDCIKQHLHEFYCRAPGILIDCILIDDFNHGLRTVRTAQADLLVFAAPAPIAANLYAEVIRTIRFGLYASPDFASLATGSAAELSEGPFILPASGSPQDKVVQEALAARGILPERVAARAQFTHVSVNLATRGVGIAPLFETMVEKEIASGQLIKFDIELPPRYRTMFRLDRTPTREMLTVQAFVREILA